MFMSDPDFDDEFQQHSPGFEYGHAFPSPDSKKRTEDDRGASYGNAGMGTPQNGRARVLAQQRELLQKKRQSNLLSGGMVRSSLESNGAPSPFRQSVDSQYTPALPQFSAPRTTAKDPSYDASPEKDSEFTKKSRPSTQQQQQHGSASVSRYNRNAKYSDDDDDERLNEAHRRAADRRDKNDRDRSERDHRDGRDSRDYNSRGDRDYNSSNNRDRERGAARRTGGRRGQYDDDDDEDDYEYDRRGNGSGSSYNRRDQAPSSSSGQRGNYRDQRDNRDRDDDSYDGDRRYNNGSNSQSQSKWAGATGGRDVHSSYNNPTAPSSAGTDGRDSRERGSGGGNGGYRATTTEVVHSGAPQATLVGANQRGSGTPTPQQQQQQQVPLAIVAPNLTDMRAFLCSPLPKNNGVLQCYIRRNKSGTNKLFPIYSLYLKEGDVFLMASKKRPKNKTSNYLISMDQNDLHRQGRGYLGKLRSNFVGTEFQVFDNGVNPKDCDPDEVANSNGAVRCELGSVMYAANVLGSRGPRKMQVALPGLDEHGRIMQWKDTSDSNNNNNNGGTGSGDDILTRMKDRNMRDLSYLINKPPRWNEQVGAYVLNFNGRVTMASVKNFQLVDPDEQNAVVLQFGRVGKDEFTMDLQHPISPFQAFAVTLSSFDSKIACD